jgi:protein-tyrosine phosphatase
MMAETAYLSAAFAAIDEKYGSFESYVGNGLGLSRADVARLQSLYLE